MRDDEWTEAYNAWRREADAIMSSMADALNRFAMLARIADTYGHTSGSTCEWRIAYDDLNAARTALESYRNKKW